MLLGIIYKFPFSQCLALNIWVYSVYCMQWESIALSINPVPSYVGQCRLFERINTPGDVIAHHNVESSCQSKKVLSQSFVCFLKWSCWFYNYNYNYNYKYNYNWNGMRRLDRTLLRQGIQRNNAQIVIKLVQPKTSKCNTETQANGQRVIKQREFLWLDVLSKTLLENTCVFLPIAI